MTELLYDKDIECLYCQSTFTTKKIRLSKVLVDKKDSDFCVHYTSDENPYYYEVWVCPHCGFAFNASFQELKPAQKEIVKKEYIQRIGSLNLCGPRTWEEALQAVKLALLCASLSGQSNSIIASLCLRIAWLNRFQGNRAEEEKFLGKAIQSLEEAYNNDNLAQSSLGEQKILYLLGELNGRLGNFAETRRWFNILLSQRNIEPAINNLAREQWAEYKSKLA